MQDSSDNKQSEFDPSAQAGKKTLGAWASAFKRFDAWKSRRDVLIVSDLKGEDSLAALTCLLLSPRVNAAGAVLPAGTTSTVAALLKSLPRGKKLQIVSAPVLPRALLKEADFLGRDFILEKARRHSSRNRLLVLILGQPGHVAAALAKDITLAERIEVVAAAFDGWPGGGSASLDTPDWQVLIDAEDLPFTVASKTVALKELPLKSATLNFHWQGTLAKHSVQSLLAPEVKDPGARQPRVLQNLLAAAFVTGFADTVAYARPVLKDDGAFLHGGSTAPLPCQVCVSEPRLTWVNQVDASEFWSDTGLLFRRADRALMKQARRKKGSR